MAAPNRQAEPTTPYLGQTFLKLQTSVLGAINLTATDADATTLAQAKDLINEAVALIAGLNPALVILERYTTFSTVADQGAYNLPKGLIRVVDPIVVDGSPVYSMPEEYRNRLYNPDQSETEEVSTRYYTVRGWNDAAVNAERQARLTFVPAPSESGTAELFYVGHDNALSADTDIVRLPREFSTAPYWYAVQPLLHERGRMKEMTAADAKWQEILARLKLSAVKSQVQGKTLIWPNYLNSGRGARYNGLSRNIP